MADQFNYLFTPLSIGNVAIKNRIFFPPHTTYFTESDGLPNERLADYHAERAKGGVGLIITESVVVHPSGRARATTICGFDQACIPGFKLICTKVHEYGAKIFGQLSHRGREMNSIHTRRPLWGPSPIPSRVSGEIPHEMTREEIQEMIQGFAQAAFNLKEAGYDGVELHGAHGYLLAQFMSTLSNQRRDEYGGSLENRLRFPIQAVQAVRDAVGPDMAIGIRLSGDELVPGGLTLQDMLEITPKLEETGMFDYLSVSIGNYNTHYIMIGDMSIPLGAAVYLAANIKEVVELPVFTVLRIKDPHQAEKILADGQADMVGMCRALITDPELPRKSKEGRFDEIRNCIACNQECRTHRIGRMISCVQNPAVGFEKTLGAGTFRPASPKKEVVVIGGGPAGMEAAIVAASRGHHVTLYEKKSQLGGQVNIACKIPTRNEFGDITRYQERQIVRFGVKVVLEREVNPEMIQSENPDVVIVASGSEPLRPALKGADLPHAINVWDVLQESVEVGKNVVVVDGGESFWPCCGAADFLLEKGHKVEIISFRNFIGFNIPSESLPLLYQRLLSKGGILTPQHNVIEILEDSVIISHIRTSETRHVQNVDTVVLAAGNKARDNIYSELKGQVKVLYAVGDCVAPRKVQDAIREGHMAGRTI